MTEAGPKGASQHPLSARGFQTASWVVAFAGASFSLAALVLRLTSSTLLGSDPKQPASIYGAYQVILGNGQGYFTEIPGFRRSGPVVRLTGGPSPTSRDAWKNPAEFSTLNYGVRWSRRPRAVSRLRFFGAHCPCSVWWIHLSTGYNPCFVLGRIGLPSISSGQDWGGTREAAQLSTFGPTLWIRL